ncbi:MAG TPA: tetratricopeptide repeat protein [Bacteroidota bacterium]|nr:tetratricopeptide repeat protein [Bacteroidota bacterium]
MNRAPKLSPSKRIIFSIIPALLIVGILAAAEILIRLFNPSGGNHFTNEAKFDNREWYQTNRSYLKKYFPWNAPSVPEFKSALFKKDKGHLFRIVCLGESSMFGTPYEMTATIPAIVRKELRHAFPGREFEVVNLGASAINTNVIRDFVPLLAEYSPDLVLIYTGHNEFYGPDGVGAFWPEKIFSPLIRWKYGMKDFRLVEAGESWLKNHYQEVPEGTPSNLMYQVSQGSHIALASSDAERIFDRFQDNMTAILRTLHDSRIPVIVSEVSSNLFFPPFVTDTVKDAGLLNEIPEKFKKGALEDVLTTLSPRVAAEPENAFYSYWLGRSLFALGKYDSARSYLERARDNDLLKFRAPGKINAILRDVCRQFNVPCLSADSALGAACPGGIGDSSVFWEHLHPTVLGYHIIAELFVKEILKEEIPLSLSNHSVSPSPLPFNYDSLSICWLDLAYADRSVEHLTGRWPFTNYHRTPVVMQFADSTLRSVVDQVYYRTTTWDEALYKTATYFWRYGNLRAALTSYEAELEEYPYNFYAQYLTGNLLRTMGRNTEAVTHYQISISSNSQYPYSSLDLGLLDVNDGQYQEASDHLHHALSVGVSEGNKGVTEKSWYGLAALHARMLAIDSALVEVRNALSISPNDPEALALQKALAGSR